MTEAKNHSVDGNTKNIVPRCHLPWQEMIIQADGTVEPCCYWTAHGNVNDPLGNVNDESISEIWNGERYRALRRNMAQGNLKAAGCANCYALKQGMTMGLEYDHDADLPENRNTAYAQNIRILKDEVAVGAEFMEAKPTIISATVSHKCNLACTHCYQNSSRSRQWARPDRFTEIEALVPTLVRLIAGGGEPLLLSRWRKFITTFDIRKAPFLNYGMTTNATVVKPDILEGLRKFKSLHIIVSMDGASPEVYDKIRVNGNFHDVERNITTLREAVGHRSNTSVTTFGLCMSVMKSNITHLPDFVRWAAKHGLSFSLHPVLSMPFPESLKSFNDPHQEMSGWRDALDEARKLVRTIDSPNLPEVWRQVQAVRGRTARDAWPFFDALESFIPWQIEAVPHSRISVPLSSEMIKDVNKSLEQCSVVFALEPIERQALPAGIGVYYGRLDSSTFSVSLPIGSYSVSAMDEFEVSRFQYLGVLNFDGQRAWMATSAQVSPSKAGLPLFNAA